MDSTKKEVEELNYTDISFTVDVKLLASNGKHHLIGKTPTKSEEGLLRVGEDHIVILNGLYPRPFGGRLVFLSLPNKSS